MGISKRNWRFSNITPDFTDTCEQVEQALAKGIAWADQHRAWADFIEATWEGGTLTQLCYAYGLSHEKMVEMLRWDVLFYLKEGHRALVSSEGWMYPLKRLPAKHLCYYGIAMLINDDPLMGKVADLICKAEPTEDVSNRFTIPEHFQLIRRIVGKQYDADAIRLANRTVQGNAISFGRYISHLGRLDEAEFNVALQADIEESIGNKEARAKKRRELPHDMVRLSPLCIVAIALDSGLRFTYYDPALPIWDFPIAQRPEIQKLLTPEMIERIPEASVFGPGT